MGHQVTAPLPETAVCELVAALLNNSMAVYEMGPASTAMERSVIAWMARALGYPPILTVFSDWASRDGCTGSPVETFRNIDGPSAASMPIRRIVAGRSAGGQTISAPRR